MMMCPQCGRAYPDDLMYCLQDGSALSPDPSAAGEEPTVIRAPRRTGPAIASTIPGRKSAGWLKLAVPAVLLLTVAAVAAVAAILFLRPMLESSSIDRASAPANTPSSAPRPAENLTPSSPSPTPSPAETETPARTVERRENRNPDETDETDNPEDGAGDGFTDPGPERISFRRGSASDTVAGRIAEERSFLLYTMAGQQLSARVRSADNCVEFADGGTSTGFSTRQGDSRVTIVNNCDRPSRFSLSVTVR